MALFHPSQTQPPLVIVTIIAWKVASVKKNMNNGVDII